MSEFRRVLGWREGAALTVASVLGSGLLYLPALTAQLAGPASVLAWLGMGLLIIPVALTLTRLAVQRPDAGGIAAFVRAAYGPAGGALTGWLFLGTVPLGAPIAALIGSGYFVTALGLSPSLTVPLAALLLLPAIWLNVLGVQISGRAASIVVGAVLVILIAAVVAGLPDVRLVRFTPFFPHGWTPVLRDMDILFWAFVGWESVAHYTEEFADPARDLRRGLAVSIIAIDVLYLLISVATVGTHTYGGAYGADSMAVLLGRALGGWAAVVTAVLALLVSYGTVHAFIGGFARLVYAQARSGDFPRFFAQLHPTRATPARVLWTLGGVFVAVLGFDLLRALPMAQLVAWSSSLYIGLYCLAMLAGLRLLSRPGERLLALLALIVCLVILPFLGFIALFPVAVGLLGYSVHRSRQRRDALRLAR